MDVYRALNADVPQLLFSVLHQARPTASNEDYLRTVTTLHKDIRHQFQVMGDELSQWLQKQYSEQAEETIYKLQRLNVLQENIDLGQLQDALVRDYRRLGNRLGSASLLGMLGTGEEVFDSEMPAGADLARRVVDGHEYLTALGFKPGQGVLHESWLLCRGSVHDDILEYLIRERMGFDRGGYGDQWGQIAHASFSAYKLIYQIGESLAADLVSELAIQEVTLVFSKEGPVSYTLFRQEVAALMEHVAESVQVLHASFWQKKPGMGIGKEFVLRLRLPAGEKVLQELVGVIGGSREVGEEVIVKRGKLLLGKRVL